MADETEMSDYVPMQGREVIAQFVGPITLWLGEKTPSLDLIFTYDAGGFVDLSPGGSPATINVYIARYRGAKVVMTGTATIIDATKGQALFNFPSVFTVPGLYEGQAALDFGGGQVQSTQKFLIHVRVGTPTS